MEPCPFLLGSQMKSPHILRASGNVQQMRANLVDVLDAAAIAALERAIAQNAAQLFRLGMAHYYFARRQNSRAWRQKISRLYYAAYNISRAVRLSFNGEFSVEVGDHKKVDVLPGDFPNVNTYSNRLSALREDRNLCDYDHTARIRDLVVDVKEWHRLVTDFGKDARLYLQGRGVSL